MIHNIKSNLPLQERSSYALRGAFQQWRASLHRLCVLSSPSPQILPVFWCSSPHTRDLGDDGDLPLPLVLFPEESQDDTERMLVPGPGSLQMKINMNATTAQSETLIRHVWMNHWRVNRVFVVCICKYICFNFTWAANGSWKMLSVFTL